MKRFLFLLLFFLTQNVFAGFPQGTHEKMYKDALQFKFVIRTLAASTVDPTAVATPGEPGDIVFGPSEIYFKLDSGTSTNWDTMVQDVAFQAHIVDTTTHGTTGDIVGTTDTQTLSNKTLTSPVINTSVSGTAILDEDNLVSDSDTQLATQQSIKAYSDVIAGDLATHILDTTTHGTTGDIVGTTDIQTLTNKTLSSAILNAQVTGTAVLDEDNMASDSDLQIATQQSIKAYVDNELLAATFPDDTFRIYDNAAPTRLGAFDASTITAGNTRTYSLPDVDGALTLLDATQTLTNKTVTSAILNTQVTGTAVLDEDAMTSDSDTQIATQQSIKAYVDNEISNKNSFEDQAFFIYDNTDNSKRMSFQAAAISAATTRTFTVPNADGTLVLVDLNQTLTNKTLTSGVLNVGVSGTAVLDEDDLVSDSDTQIATQQSIKAYADEEHGKIYPTNVTKLTGDNSNFENDAGDWITYADAAGTIPVDGTGGAPTLTAARFSPSVMRGTGNFLITKDAADRQGEGTSVDFSTDLADAGKVLRVKFDYETSTNYVDGDITVYIYDVTNAAIIRVISGEDLIAGELTHHAYFQTSVTSISYRLILHVGTTNATAYTINGDRFGVRKVEGESAGTIVADWVDGNCTSTWIANTTTTCKYKRVGDSAEIQFKASVIGGAPTATALKFDLPSGLVYDTTKLEDTTHQEIGSSYVLNNGVATYQGVVRPDAGQVRPMVFSTGAPVAYETIVNVTNLIPFSINTGDTVTATITVPITGWETGVKPNEVLSGRSLYNQASGNDGDSITASTEDIPFKNVVDGTNWTNAGNTGANTADAFTAPETGFYILDGVVNHGTAGSINFKAYLDGSLASPDIIVGASEGHTDTPIRTIVHLNRGQVLTIRGTSGMTLTNSTNHRISVINLNYLNGVIQPNETIAARYNTNTATAIGGTNTVIPYEDLVTDSHGIYNTVTGNYEIPVSDWYNIKMSFLGGPAVYAVGNGVACYIQVDTVTIAGDFTGAQTAASHALACDTQADAVYLTKGQVVRASGTSSVAMTLNVTAHFNTFSIIRVGR